MTDTFTIPDAAPAPEPVSIADAEPGTDPEAPYGRFANGKPRKAPAPKKPARTAPAPKASSGPRPPKRQQQADFRPIVRKGFGFAVMGLVALSGGGRNRAFLADAATVQAATEDGARVVNDFAQDNPALARLLTQTAPAVPYLELASFIFGLGTQLAANHGVRLPLPGGTVADPEQLANAMEQQLHGMAEANAARAAAEEREAEWIQREGAAVSRLVREGRRGGPHDTPADHTPADHGFAAV